MGLSSFWTAIKRPRVSETPSRKHVERTHDLRHNDTPKDSPALETGDSSPHHLDAIYDTHHHIIPHSKGGPKRHPSSPPRIHSPTSKEQKRGSLWKSHSLSIKPHHQASDEAQPTKTVEKRRSFWRSDSKATKAPAVQAPDTAPTLTRAETRGLAYEDTHLLSANNPTTSIKAKRSSLRLSLRRTVSSKSSRSRLSWLGGRVDDSDDDEDIPALPPIPVNLRREQSKAQDPGRYMGMADSDVLPGTAITSDDLYSTAKADKRKSNRQSLTSIITKRKSGGNLSQKDQDTGSNKRKRRSWFSVHGETSPDTALPPLPALPHAVNSDQSTVDPSEMAFRRFLHNSHNARPQGPTTDYERFLVASRAYDDSKPSPPLFSHYNSRSTAHTSLQQNGAPNPALHPALKRSTYAAPRARRSRASHCRPHTARDDGENEVPESGRPFLSIEQQHEWNKLRDLLDDTIKTVSPTSSLDDEDDNGVMGMMRELNRDVERDVHYRSDRSRRQHARGYGTWANDEALARLEFGR